MSQTPRTGTRTAVVTGASSGIGRATALRLAAAGHRVIAGARRTDRLAELARTPGIVCVPLDVTDQTSVDRFTEAVDRCDVLVNNAGGAIGTDAVADADIAAWQAMFDVNVLGVLRLTKALLPALIASGDGQVVTIGSIAAREPYRGGGGYNAAKHAVAALTRVLRIELLGAPVRVSQIDPGLVETEFSVNRFAGDTDAAARVYAGMTPLTADDIAEAVTWVVERPAHVNIDSMLVLARDQTSAQVVHRS
ncbi:SDR family NAD(P)-dependent oxidoreductase [Streptomyces sp. NPDC090106]|uniref:SDR family NAD(P)-dependent oxidoreductase n=1 Tax=Streptomyces sp. NPDC090106 TaxID=3365946 RepID=UPI0038142E5B